MTKKYGYIYQIENLINGKKYIGQTINEKGHRQFPSAYKGNNHLYSSYKKYGIENFEITIINNAKNQKKLNKKEEFYIQKFNTLNSDFGYNMRHGGSHGKFTQEQKDLMSFNRIQKTFSKKFLEQEYLINKKSLNQIALEQNCNRTTITRKLKEYNIPIRNQNISFTKRFLKREYLKNKKSIRQIADENNCFINTILKNLKEYNIPIKITTKRRYISFTKNFLEREYLKNEKTIRQIADENNCSAITVLKNLREYNIPRRTITNRQHIFFTKKFLEREYLKNKKSMRQIAYENNCHNCTILNRLREYNIPTRTSVRKQCISFTKNFLKQEYLTNKKSITQIADENNCSYTTIFRRLIEYNIPIKTEKQRISFTKKFLKREYLKNKKTIEQIANENNSSISTIYGRLREYNIPRR